MIQSKENLVTEGWTYRRPDGQEWFHRMLSNKRRAPNMDDHDI